MQDVHLLSLGLQFNWSRWKLRVQASSVPTNPINTLIHLSIFCEKSDKEQIFIPRGDPYSYLDFISFFFSFEFLIKQIWEFPLLQLVPIDGRETYVHQYNYWQHYIQVSKRAGSGFLITPDPCNGIEYHMVPGSTYTNGIRFLYDTKTK